MTVSIESDHLDNSPAARDAHNKDCNPTLKVYSPQLNKVSLSPGSSSYLKGMHLEGMLVLCVEKLKEQFADSTLRKQSSHRPAWEILPPPIYTTTEYLQLKDTRTTMLEGQELNSRTQNIRRPLYRLFTKIRSMQISRMTSILLRDCLESEYAGSEGVMSYNISSSGKEIQKRKILGWIRRIFTGILSRSTRANLCRDVEMIEARTHVSKRLSKHVLESDRSSFVLLQLTNF
jgi:hypothetical protein